MKGNKKVSRIVKIRGSKALIDRVYDENKVIWHRGRAGELHHIFGRVGVVKCCPRMFAMGMVGHQLDWKWVRELRDDRREDLGLLADNYMRGLGCKEWIFAECSWCAMPKYGENEKG